MRLERRHFLILLGPTLLILLGLLAFPTVYVLVVSLRDFQLTAGPTAERPFVGLENYASLLSDPSFFAALGRSLVFTVTSVGLTFVLGLAIALLLNRRDIPGVGFTRTVILVPLILTPLVIGATYRFMLETDNGIVNELLGFVGLGPIPFLADPTWAMVSVILVDAWQWTPFATLVLLAGLESLPAEPFEAARVDGASRWSTLWFITLPLLAAPIAVVLLIRTMDAFREFDKIFIMTAGGPGTATETLPLFLYRIGFQDFDMGSASATGLVMLIIVTIVSLLFVRRIHSAGE
jgi:multiple sugar transport system permease protein